MVVLKDVVVLELDKPGRHSGAIHPEKHNLSILEEVIGRQLPGFFAHDFPISDIVNCRVIDNVSFQASITQIKNGQVLADITIPNEEIFSAPPVEYCFDLATIVEVVNKDGLINRKILKVGGVCATYEKGSDAGATETIIAFN